MAITINEFLGRISAPDSELYLMVCTDLVVFDKAAQVIYLPIATHDNANLNPIGDLRTHIGHGLLWSHQVELQCTSHDLNNALYTAGYELLLHQAAPNYRIFTMIKQANIAVKSA